MVGVALVQQASDDEADDGIAQELQALVVAIDGLGVLVEERAVHERLANGVRVAQMDPKSLGQIVEARDIHQEPMVTAGAPR